MGCNIFYYDVESTGKDHKVHGIHQLSCILTIDNKVHHRQTFHINLFKEDSIDPASLDISSMTEKDIRKMGNNPVFVHGQILELLGCHIDIYNPKEKIFLAGFGNSYFDDLFFNEWFKKCGDNRFYDLFWHVPLDISCIAANVLRYERSNMDSFNLPAVARRFGIDVVDSKLHHSDYDVDLAFQIHQVINK